MANLGPRNWPPPGGEEWDRTRRAPTEEPWRTLYLALLDDIWEYWCDNRPSLWENCEEFALGVLARVREVMGTERDGARAALAVFADRGNWKLWDRALEVYAWHPDGEPWTIAQAALGKEEGSG